MQSHCSCLSFFRRHQIDVGINFEMRQLGADGLIPFIKVFTEIDHSICGELQYYWGAFGGTRGGFAGGLSRPHQLDVDQDGNVYIASWDGGWMNKFVPRPGADPNKLIGKRLVLAN